MVGVVLPETRIRTDVLVGGCSGANQRTVVFRGRFWDLALALVSTPAWCQVDSLRIFSFHWFPQWRWELSASDNS